MDAPARIASLAMATMAHGGAWLRASGVELWFFTFALVLIFPFVDNLLYFRLRSTLRIYVWNILAEWSLVAACAWVIHKNGLTLADFGERLGNPLRTLVVAGLALVTIAVLTIASRTQTRKVSPEQLRKATANVRKLLPATGYERTVFVAVALTAGLCEEFLYRGWLLNVIAAATGSLWVALIVSSIVFGLAHFYQGPNGMFGATVLGVVFGTLFIASGSLLPVQALHALIDLNNGLALGKVSSQSDGNYAVGG
ncbi:MAG TPA: type II CAAX endopeptidase family protein [Bryobacteraceae bacterium]|nr:type II CAAX endopeptidase family protein [Bryobacteraceae bacterium]